MGNLNAFEKKPIKATVIFKIALLAKLTYLSSETMILAFEILICMSPRLNVSLNYKQICEIGGFSQLN